MTSALVAVLASLSIAVALLLLVPVGVLVLQTLGYLFGNGTGPSPIPGTGAQEPRLAVLMPAHNEEQVIGVAIAAVLSELRSGDRLVVVADNCTDGTAQIALAAGAQVTVRSDATRRGKGYALDWGVRTLEADPPEVVVIVDADCEVETGSLERLAKQCAITGRPLQATYLMDLPQAPSVKLRVAAFAWLLKTQLRALGYHRLGLPCQLMGTGMAFPWALIRNAPLASGNIVEDVQLGVDLAIAGYAPVFCPQAAVRSCFPASDADTDTQRRRWEQGHLSTLGTQVPRLLRSAVRGRRMQLAAIAADLSVPPLALLIVLQAAVVGLNGTMWWLTSEPVGLSISVLGIALLLAIVAIAWMQLGRRVLSLGQLVGIPLYIAGKLPMYLRLLADRRKAEWVRTGRDDRPR